MQKTRNNMMKLTMIILILVIIILIGIVMNTNTSNMINNHEKNKGQQLEETNSNNSYIEMQKHLSEVEEYYERGKSDASVVILRAMYNSNTLTQEYPGCSSSVYTVKKSDSDSDSCSGVIPITYQKDGKYYLLNSISTGAVSQNHNNCNDCVSSGSSTATFYTYNSINKTKISNISSANGGNEKVDLGGIGTTRKLTIALFEQNITEDVDSIYYEGSTGAWANSYCTYHDYAQSIARGEIQTVVATYIELTV